MKYILLKRRTFDEYIYEKTNNLNLSDLIHFLSEIDFDEIDEFITWGKNSKERFESTNTTDVRKYNDEVCITMDADGSEFRMPLQEFIKLLEQWKECISKNPERIIITQEDNEFNCKPLED